MFGSNGQEKADYSKGVLERFTRRAPNDWMIPKKNKPENLDAPGNCYVKVIVNPRKINFNQSPHQMVYYSDCYVVDENANLSGGSCPMPIIADKIVINHYYIKSREEFLAKVNRGSSARTAMVKKLEWFGQCDRNEEFDDGILQYRDARAKAYRQIDNSNVDERLFSALSTNLSPHLSKTAPSEFYKDKIETFLTCRAVASYLQTKLEDNIGVKLFEVASLTAILKSLDAMCLADAELLIREVPNFLSLSNPATKELFNEIIQRIPQIKEELRLQGFLREFIGLDYLQDLFKVQL